MHYAFLLFVQSWAALKGGTGERGGLPSAVPLPLPLSPAAPRKNFDADKVPSGNHTHAKL